MATSFTPPKWLTKAGSLGTIPELEYYTLSLDAYDPNGGNLAFFQISGKMPVGLQVVSNDTFKGIRGVPVSELAGDVNVEYVFTIRVINESTGFLADRTFSITITNVAPPIIIPKNVNLGLYFDGTEIDFQLEAIDASPLAQLVWSLDAGALPPGLTLSSSGRITGYIDPLIDPALDYDPDWDKTNWDSEPWAFTNRAQRRSFEFTIKVFDGVYYDRSVYRIEVFPKSFLTADNVDANLTTDTNNIEFGPSLISNENATVINQVGPELTVDTGVLHNPIILTTQSELTPVRQASYFSFKINAKDLDYDDLQYFLTQADSSAFDGQDFSSTISYPYVPYEPIGNLLYGGVWPKMTSEYIGGQYVSTVDEGTVNYINGDIIKVLDSSRFWHLAIVNNETVVRVTGNVRVRGNVGDIVRQAEGGANATITAITSTSGFLVFDKLVTANVGEFITQLSSVANAAVTANVVNQEIVPVAFNMDTNLGDFDTTGNVKINGVAFLTHPVSVQCQTDITAIYNTESTFGLSQGNIADLVYINSVNTHSYASSIRAVGVVVNPELADESVYGYDEEGVKFDQTVLGLPGTLSIDVNSGWITGQLPSQTVNEIVYPFEVTVKKRTAPTYKDSQLYNLTVMGDLYNYVEWISDTDLGTIQNGRISDKQVQAINTKGKPLFYSLTGSHRLPQGLMLMPSGLISGRVSFEMFGLDAESTTLDGGDTTFDSKYTFTVLASDTSGAVADIKTFTITVVKRNSKPFENLYLKALPAQEQRDMFLKIMQNKSIFTPEFIYRGEDPFFGIAKDIKTLFLPGLNPSKLSDYAAAVYTNHYTKRLTFGDVKTATVLDEYFKPKYEVVYLEVLDENSNSAGQGPQDTIDITEFVQNPYYDLEGNPYFTIYPNSFNNMKDVVISKLGYANKGALPDWMTSNQPTVDGGFSGPLGFTRAVVLAYTIVGASSKIAFRFKEAGYNLNQIDFTVDRYQLDNSLSTNYTIPTKTYTFNVPISTTTGDVLTQTVTGTRAVALETVSSLSTVKVQIMTGGFAEYSLLETTTAHNIYSNVLINNTDVGAYPISSSLVPTNGSFITSAETTFDRYSGISSVFKVAGTVDYAVSVPFEDINGKIATEVQNLRLLDGARTIKSGETVVFYEQEFKREQGDLHQYNQGWSRVTTVWEGNRWDYDNNTFITSDDLEWDATRYVNGFKEHNLDSGYLGGTVGFPDTPLDADLFVYNRMTYVYHSATNTWRIPNERVGVWQIEITSSGAILLNFIKEISFYDRLYVRKGLKFGRTNIYYDPAVKNGLTMPNYTVLKQRITVSYTKFDGNGTRFFDHRDNYQIPETGDKYIKFAKTGVFT